VGCGIDSSIRHVLRHKYSYHIILAVKKGPDDNKFLDSGNITSLTLCKVRSILSVVLYYFIKHKETALVV
jgi:hypothetical protein